MLQNETTEKAGGLAIEERGIVAASLLDKLREVHTPNDYGKFPSCNFAEVEYLADHVRAFGNRTVQKPRAALLLDAPAAVALRSLFGTSRGYVQKDFSRVMRRRFVLRLVQAGCEAVRRKPNDLRRIDSPFAVEFRRLSVMEKKQIWGTLKTVEAQTNPPRRIVLPDHPLNEDFKDAAPLRRQCVAGGSSVCRWLLGWLLDWRKGETAPPWASGLVRAEELECWMKHLRGTQKNRRKAPPHVLELDKATLSALNALFPCNGKAGGFADEFRQRFVNRLILSACEAVLSVETKFLGGLQSIDFAVELRDQTDEEAGIERMLSQLDQTLDPPEPTSNPWKNEASL